MSKQVRRGLAKPRAQKLREAMDALRELGFAPKQRNEVAGYTLLALLDLRPRQAWHAVQNPLRGITPIIEFVAEHYGVRYAPNTRETIRDEAVKYFVEAGLLVRNPDDPARPTNSAKTAYQVETHALNMLRTFGTAEWDSERMAYLESRHHVLAELSRRRDVARIPVTLPAGEGLLLSPGGQNPLIKSIIEEFVPRWAPGGRLVYVGDAENKLRNLDATYLGRLGVRIPAPAKMPDVVVHHVQRDWLLLVEAVTSAGPVDGKRRKELKELFAGCSAGLVFVTAFETRTGMRSFLGQLSWESEVWIAAEPDHLIHFDGERFLGPYPDVAM